MSRSDLDPSVQPLDRRPLAPLLGLALGGDPSPEIVLVLLMATRRASPTSGPPVASTPPSSPAAADSPVAQQIAAPVVLVVGGTPAVPGGSTSVVDLAGPGPVPGPGEALNETISAVYDEAELAALAWRYDAAPGAVGLTFLTNGFELADDIGAEAARAAASGVQVRWEEPW